MDQWLYDGARITDPAVLDQLDRVLEEVSDLIVEHRFFHGARAPHRFVCNSGPALRAYLAEQGHPGDSFYLWEFEQCCKDGSVRFQGKVPDANGRVPSGGAY